MNQNQIFEEIKALAVKARSHVTVAETSNLDNIDYWEVAYDLIFSSHISKRVSFLVSKLGMSLDYYDPDTTYEEDVKAYVAALESFVEKLSKFQ